MSETMEGACWEQKAYFMPALYPQISARFGGELTDHLRQNTNPVHLQSGFVRACKRQFERIEREFAITMYYFPELSRLSSWTFQAI